MRSLLRTSLVLGSGAAFAVPRRSAMTMNLFGAFSVKKEIDYGALSGMPKSLGYEMGEFAVKGETASKTKDGYSLATFGIGCFWGAELAFQRVPGVVATCVGYSQGHVEKPTYEEVCGSGTGHTEIVTVSYDEKEVSYEQLLDVFWERLGGDATKFHQAGNDRGPQYRHGIYTHSQEQLEAATKSKEQRQAGTSAEIYTEVEPVGIVWPAEEYHQQYLEKGGRFNSPQSAAKGATETIRCYG